MATTLSPALPEKVVNALVSFANAEIKDPHDAVSYFKGFWKPSRIPSLAECRNVQEEVREWLTAFRRSSARGVADAVSEVNLVGKVSSVGVRKRKYVATRSWWLSPDTKLRAVCGFAAWTALEAGMRDHVGLCAREACGTFYVGRRSRGTPRKFCRTDECMRALHRERVATIRSKRERKQRSGKPRGQP
jgi:hypothetical protein